MSDDKITIRERYLEQMVEGASQEGLLLLLVDGAVNFIRRAKFAFEKDRLDDVNIFLIKAQNIYLELVLHLDLDAGEFAENLGFVYQYLYNLLIEANIEKDIAKIKTGLKLAEDIRDLWKETIEKAKGEPEGDIAQSSPGVSNGETETEPVLKTGVYELAENAGLVESKQFTGDSPSQLNITG
jgi:flagellar protein FliS